MKKRYQDDEFWTAVNPLTGKQEIVDPEGEFILGETIVRWYYCKRLDGYVTIRGLYCSKSQQIGYSSKTTL